MWSRPGRIRVEGSSHTVAKSINIANTVDRYGFFENQLVGGTYMTFDQSIGGVRVQSICTNFDGTWAHGSYIKINGTVVASDHSLSPDGTDNRVDSMNRGTTSSDHGISGAGNQYGVGFWMQRGHTVVIIDNHGVVQSTTCYDTWGDGTLCDTIASALQAMPAGWIVGIGTYDACSLNQNFRNALTNYFNDTDYTNTWPSRRQSQMFLGKRNSIT
jgi:hypothetical protein